VGSGRPVPKSRNTPAVARVRLAAIEKWNAGMDEKLATLEAASPETRKYRRGTHRSAPEAPVNPCAGQQPRLAATAHAASVSPGSPASNNLVLELRSQHRSDRRPY